MLLTDSVVRPACWVLRAIACSSLYRIDRVFELRQNYLLNCGIFSSRQVARRAYLRIARFFASLRAKAEQLDAVQRWYRILSEALRKYLRGRQLIPPARLQPG